jgi:hypothetical protein
MVRIHEFYVKAHETLRNPTWGCFRKVALLKSMMVVVVLSSEKHLASGADVVRISTPTILFPNLMSGFDFGK